MKARLIFLRRYWRRYMMAGLLPLAATLLLWLFRDMLTTANFSLVYLLVVLIIAIYQGTGPSLFTAFVSFLCFNFFLVRPLYTFLVADPRDFLDLTIYLAAAAITGQLASYARIQQRDAQQKAEDLNILYETATEFNHLTDDEQVFRVLKKVVEERLHVSAVDFVTVVPQTSGENELYVPINGGQAMHVLLDKAPAPSLQRLINACTSQAAIALERIALAKNAQQSKTFEEADRLKTAILHSVSHDLRTPITIIKTSASNLTRLHDSISDANRTELVKGIEAEADHLDKMVGNLLDISRLNAGVLQINKTLNSLEEVVNDVAARIWQLTHEQRLEINFPADMPLVSFDYGLILQAVSNLLENALRYEPEGSQIKIVGSVQDQEAQVALINHGPTISLEERNLIMEPFYHSKEGNTGLGLAIAKGIIEAHRGQLQIEDTPGGGATFILTLPLDNLSLAETGNMP